MTVTHLEAVVLARVVDHDHIHGPEVMAFPPAAMNGFREERPIFCGSRYDDIRAVFRYLVFRRHRPTVYTPT